MKKFLLGTTLFALLGLIGCGEDSSSGSSSSIDNLSYCFAEELDDSTGYKLVCGGNEVGTIKNGTSDSSGKNESYCVATPLDDEEGYVLTCGDEVIDTLRNVHDTVYVAPDTLVISSKDTVVIEQSEGEGLDTIVLMDTIYNVLDTLFIGVDTSSAYGLGFCNYKREGEIAQYLNENSSRNGVYFTCEAGAWRVVRRGELDSCYFLPKTCENGDVERTELAVEICRASKEFNNSDDDCYVYKYYQCVDGAWQNTSELSYLIGACTAANNGETKDRSSEDEYSGFYKCENEYWNSISEVEYKKGECTDELNGQVFDLESETDFCTWSYESDCSSRYAECSNGSWYAIPEQVYENGACTTEKEETKFTYKDDEGYDYYYGCTDHQWKTISEIAYRLESCTETNSGEIVTFDDDVYSSGSFGNVQWNIYGSKYAICSVNGQWEETTALVAVLGVCSSKNENVVKECSGDACDDNRYYKCSNGTWSISREKEYVEYTFGLPCETEGEKKDYGGEYSGYYYQCTNNIWKSITCAEYSRSCTSDNEGTYMECNGGEYYKCSSFAWISATEEEYIEYYAANP